MAKPLHKTRHHVHRFPRRQRRHPERPVRILPQIRIEVRRLSVTGRPVPYRKPGRVVRQPQPIHQTDHPAGSPRTAFCQQDPFRIRSGRLQRILPQPTLRDPNRIRPDPRSMVRRGTSQAERRTDLQLSRLEKTDQGTCPQRRYLRTGRCPVVRQ